MSNLRNPTPEAAGMRLDEAVRRATATSRMAKMNRRALLRALGMYANVFAVLIALGLPNGNLRRAAGGAMASLDGVVRQASSGVMSASEDYFYGYRMQMPVLETPAEPDPAAQVEHQLDPSFGSHAGRWAEPTQETPAEHSAQSYEVSALSQAQGAQVPAAPEVR